MRDIRIADKRLLSVLAILFLAGCSDRIVKVETFPELATVGEGTAPCTKSGFCVACGMTYAGKFNCSPALRPNCPGTKVATIKHIPARRTLKSGLVEHYTVDTVVLATGACQ